MSNNTSAEQAEFVLYNGEYVALLSVEHSAYGNYAFVSFEDGREEEVPFTALEFLA